MNQEKIIQAIAASLRVILIEYGVEWKRQEIINDMVSAIAPHLEAGTGWEDAPEWANYKTVDPDSTTTFWEYKPIIDLSDGTWYRKSGNRLVVGDSKSLGSHKIFEKRPR